MKNVIKVTIVVTGLAGGIFAISCVNNASHSKDDVKWKEVIKKHIDTTVKVYGHYAAVKLPIHSGVNLWNPTAIALGPKGVMYAANYTGEIYSLHDTDGDGLEDSAKLYCNVKQDGLRYPTSIVFKGNKLYVGTTQEIRAYEDTNADEVADKSYTFFKDFPHTLHYFDWTFGLTFGPDGHLFAILCTDALNDHPAPDPHGLRGAILKIAPDGKSYERFSAGLRFAYGMAFNKQGDLFFTDNRGNENKYEELNFAQKGYFYGNNPSKYPTEKNSAEPLLKLKYGFAPVGIRFNPSDNNFGKAQDLIVSFFGPDGQWGDGSISRVQLTKDSKGSYQAQEFPIADKIAKLADLAFGEQGDLYVAQFGNDGPMHLPWKTPMGAIYRMIQADWIKPADPKKSTAVVEGNVHNGQAMFNQRMCATCHSIDGNGALLGPDLAGIGKLLSKSALLESIKNPNKNIKTGFDQMVIELKNGTTINGRMVTTNKDEISIISFGNKKSTIKQKDIKSSKVITASLMPPGLLDGLTDDEVNDLLGYLESLEAAK